MSNTLILKRSSTANAVPTSGQLTYGELAINYLDGNLFYKNSSDQIVTIASNKFLSVTGNVTGGNLVTTGDLSVAGLTNLGNVGNITITGGTSGYVLSTDGTGNLSWQASGGGSGNSVSNMPTYIAVGESYTLNQDFQGLFAVPITVDGDFEINGTLVDVSGNSNITGNGSISVSTVSASGTVSGLELSSTQSAPNEGGQINLALPSSGSTLSGNVVVDVYQNRLRFFEGGGTNRGAFIDLTAANAGVGTNLLAGGGGGGSPGGSNTQVQFNDNGVFGGNANFTYDKVFNTVNAGTFAGTLNGLGQNFKVGDDAWIGDINLADTIGLKGQQNAANCYIVFGNSNSVTLGRSGTGPLTYGGAFSASGNITGGNISTGGVISAAGNIAGNYFIGNGSQLTGISASGGTSNARVMGYSLVFGG